MITSFASTPVSVKDEAVLFAFDDHSIPLRDNLFLTLEQVRKHPDNPVLRTGEKGSPDEKACILYGSLIQEQDKLRMWYLAKPDGFQPGVPPGRPMAYAESEDGVHWIKPDLGLLDWHGSRKNNLCSIDPVKWYVDDYLCVIYDPDDPDPERRYKTGFRSRVPASEIRLLGRVPSRFPGGKAAVLITATSPDGLRWSVLSPDELVIKEYFEAAGIYRFGGRYYTFGQELPPTTWLLDGRPCGRVASVYQSSDFEKWTTAKCLGFVRPEYRSTETSQGEEIHMAAGLWNRGNVLVGLYGMWHGAEKHKDIRIDLGLVVSNDGLHFREPVPGFAAIPHGGRSEWDHIGLVQGHTFANINGRTCIWYGHWDVGSHGYPEEIGLGTLNQDGFGHLSRMYPYLEGHFITCLLKNEGRMKLFVNARGLDGDHPLRVELLDENDREIAGYSGEACLPITAPGARQPVRWKTGDAVEGLNDELFRIKVSFCGGITDDQSVYAVYAASV